MIILHKLQDNRSLPDSRDAGFYARHVEICRRAGVEPNPPERVRELVGKWNAMLKGEPPERKLGADRLDADGQQ